LIAAQSAPPGTSGKNLWGRGPLAPEFTRCIDRRVARRIRERRQRLGMTQQRLAQLIGVAFQQAHKYEHGISRITAGRLYHIATALETPISYFFATEEDAPPPQQDAAKR
jgi:transcriptional regulator with XRE-family HTH domain